MINVTLGAADTQKEKPFPKLMKSLIDGRITVVHKHPEKVGKYIGINMSGTGAGSIALDFGIVGMVDYNEPITIQNA